MTFEEAGRPFLCSSAMRTSTPAVGPMARPTYEAIAEAERDELGPRGGHEAFDRIMELRERLRWVVAAQIGVDADHVSLTTSTSEACRVVLAGLDLGPEDEIVTTDAEHFGLLRPGP